MSEHEAIIEIQHYLPARINIIHLYSHQDKVKGKDNLIFPEKLNKLADFIADNYARAPIKNHIPLTPLAVYFNNNYIPNNYSTSNNIKILSDGTTLLEEEYPNN